MADRDDENERLPGMEPEMHSTRAVTPIKIVVWPELPSYG